jgi:hypothetical protein
MIGVDFGLPWNAVLPKIECARCVECAIEQQSNICRKTSIPDAMDFDELKTTEVRKKAPLNQRLRKAWQLSHFLRQLSIRNFLILFTALTILFAANYKWIARDWKESQEWKEQRDKEQFWEVYGPYIHHKKEEDDRIVSAMFFSDIFDDGAMDGLSMQDLRCVDIRSSTITKDGIRKLLRMRNLEVLKLKGACFIERPERGPDLDDTCVPIIRQFPKLRDLYLYDVKLTNDGLKELSKMQSLERIELRSCTLISDDGLVHFGRMESLELLSIHGCGLSNNANEKLSRVLPKVKLILSSNPDYTDRYFDERDYE